MKKGLIENLIPEALRAHGDLVWALSKRDVLLKYRGSLLGTLWPFITPLVLLAIYTVVFGMIMNLSWGTYDMGLGGFAVMLFCGLIPFNFFNEALSRSSQIIVSSPNYVKRVAFPTDALPVVVNISALIHAAISLLILVVVQFLFIGHVAWTAIYLPIVWIPLILSAMACSLLVAAIGVFIRDLPHMLGLIFSALFFLTPIIYPADMVPQVMRFMLYINPIAYAASNTRYCMVLGITPNWTSWGLFTLCSTGGLMLATMYFSYVRKRFADVL
jgi:lipopolysaccharide transport system permease protein